MKMVLSRAKAAGSAAEWASRRLDVATRYSHEHSPFYTLSSMHAQKLNSIQSKPVPLQESNIYKRLILRHSRTQKK